MEIFLKAVGLRISSCSQHTFASNLRCIDILQGQSSSRVSSMFAGTQDKCVVCKKTVYPIEKVSMIPATFL